MHAPTNEPWLHTKHYSQSDILYGSKSPLKKVGMNRHFQGSWASRPMKCLLGRPTYANLTSSIPSFLSSAALELAGRNSTRECDFKIYARNLGYTVYKSGIPEAHYLTASQLNGMQRQRPISSERNVVYIIDIRKSPLATTRALLHRLKMSWTLVYRRLKTNGPAFLPIPSVNSA